MGREVCQWYFDLKEPDDDDELDNDGESVEGDDEEEGDDNGQQITIQLTTLLQSLDVDVLRTSLNDPFTVSTPICMWFLECLMC